MFQKFIEWVKKLFGKDVYTQTQLKRAAEDEAAYKRIDEINYTAIFANNIANKVATNSTVDVEGTGQRAELVKRGIDYAWESLRRIVQQTGGTGGKVLVPYMLQGEPLYSLIDQNRLIIHQMRGNRPVSATLVSEEIQVKDKKYYRLTDYELKDTTQVITNRAVDDSGAVVSLEQYFPGIAEQISVANCDRLLFAYLKCPVDNREDKDVYGVPLTFGAEPIIDEIKEHLKMMSREFRATRVMLGLDPVMWNDKETRSTVQNDKDGLFVKLYSDSEQHLWEIFSPQIRFDPMYARLMQLYADLEKAVGTSKGILTEPATRGATATEIKAAEYGTYVIVSEFRRNVEQAIRDLAYCFDVLAEYTGATPQGARDNYEITFDWDMSLYESSQETFAQLKTLVDMDLLSGAKLNQYVTNQSINDAQKEIDEIAQSKPTPEKIMQEELS